jgi:hypothetical protein
MTDRRKSYGDDSEWIYFIYHKRITFGICMRAQSSHTNGNGK